MLLRTAGLSRSNDVALGRIAAATTGMLAATPATSGMWPRATLDDVVVCAAIGAPLVIACFTLGLALKQPLISAALTNHATGASADGTPSPIDNGLSEFGATLLSNPALLAEIDDLLIDLTAGVVEKYRHEIGGLIAQTVAGWDPAATSRRFELAVGRDLQFVRINGTLVGGLVGLLIYSITRLVR